MRQQLLLAEDSPELADIMSELFQSLGYNVTVVETGADAIEYLGRSVPEVMITDVNLPLVSGFDVLEYLRQQEHGGSTRAIVFTGDARAKYAPQSALADVVLDKPVDIEYLLSVVGA